MIENFRPGVMARFGLDEPTLRAEHPALIYCRILGIGRGDVAGYDFLAQAVGGLMSVTGEPDREPLKVGVALVDVMAGLHATIGILAALRHRERTGEGQLVEVDLLSTTLFALANQASGYLTAGVVPGRMGNRHPSIAPYETLPTADGAIVVAVGNDAQFRTFCVLLGSGELADDPRFATNGDRVVHRDALGAARGRVSGQQDRGGVDRPAPRRRHPLRRRARRGGGVRVRSHRGAGPRGARSSIRRHDRRHRREPALAFPDPAAVPFGAAAPRRTRRRGPRRGRPNGPNARRQDRCVS